MDDGERNLIAETNLLHALWHLGPPRRQQPLYYHPQPVHYHPEPPPFRPFPFITSVCIVHHLAAPTSSEHNGRGRSIIELPGDPPATTSEASANLEPGPLSLPPPEIKREGDVDGSMDVIVLCNGEENAGQGNTDSSCNCSTSMDKKCPSYGTESNKGMVTEGDIVGSKDDTVPCQGEVCKEKGEAEEIANGVNMDSAIPVTVIFEGVVRKEQGKTQAKAFLKCEDDLADGNNLVGEEELCLPDVQLLQAEEIVNEGDFNGSRDITVTCQGEICVEKSKAEDIANEGDMEGSMHVTETEEKDEAEEIVNEVNMEVSAAVIVIPEGEVSEEQGKTETKAVVESEDGLADANSLVGGKELCLTDVQLLLDDETDNDGDMKGSMDDVIVLGPGDLCEEKGKEIVQDGDKEGSMEVTISCQHDTGEAEVIVIEGDREGSVDVTDSYKGDKWEAEGVVNEGQKESSIDVTASCQGDTWEAEEIVNEGDKESSMEVNVSFHCNTLCSAGNETRKRFIGVGKTTCGKWRARFYDPKTKQQIHLGTFDTKEAAAVAYDTAALRIKGSTALLNLPERKNGPRVSSVLSADGSGSSTGNKTKTNYKGLLQRPSGKLAAQIHDPNRKGDVCLGTFKTAEDATSHIVSCQAEENAGEGTNDAKGLVKKCSSVGIYVELNKEIVEEVNMKGPIAVIVKSEGEVCKEQGKTEKTDNDGENQGLIDASVSCLGGVSKEKGKEKEDVGAGINDSTSSSGRWLLKKCSENSSGSALSEAQFVLYNIADGSQVRRMPTINPADTQALEQLSPLEEYTPGRVDAIKNCVWGNTFFVSKRAAKLLGHILAGGFQYTPSLPAKPASSSQPTPSARKPKPRTRKQKRRA